MINSYHGIIKKLHSSLNREVKYSLPIGSDLVELNPLINQKINQILPPITTGKPRPELKIKRDYNSALRLCSFEAWIEKEN